MNKKVWIFGLIVLAAILASAYSDKQKAEAVQTPQDYKPVPLMKFDGGTVYYNENVAVCH